MLIKRAFNANFKFIPAATPGTFEGYASVFNNVDLVNDVIMPGAFKEFVLNARDEVTILLQHNSNELPIGAAVVTQDDNGLFFKGRLLLDDPRAANAYLHMQQLTLTGMSIGFDILPGGSRVREDDIRELTALKLWEISPVIWGANPEAGITNVKAAELIKTRKEFEYFLRKVGGFSHEQAGAIAGKGFSALGTPRKGADPDVADTLKRVLNAVGDLTKPL